MSCFHACDCFEEKQKALFFRVQTASAFNAERTLHCCGTLGGGPTALKKIGRQEGDYMRIRVYCSECRTYEEIDVDDPTVEPKPSSKSKSKFHSASSVGGLQNYCLVHGDHALVIQVDSNGAVRRDSVIKRCDIGVEKILSSAAEQIIAHSASAEVSHGVFFFNTDLALRHLLLTIAQVLLRNKTEGFEAELVLSDTSILLKYGQFLLYGGPWTSDIKQHRRETNSVAWVADRQIDLEEEMPPFHVMRKPTGSKKGGEHGPLALFVDVERMNDYDEYKAAVMTLFDNMDATNLFDIETPSHAAKAIRTVVAARKNPGEFGHS